MPQLWRWTFLVGLQGMEGDSGEASFLLGKLKAQPPSPIRVGHQDGTPRLVEDKEGSDRDMSQQNIDDRGDRRVGMKTGETGELQVKSLQGNTVLLVQGSVGVASYDLCAANSCVIPSQGKGAVEIGLAVSLPLGTNARIAPRLGLAVRNFIDVRVGGVDSDYHAVIKVAVFNHSL